MRYFIVLVWIIFLAFDTGTHGTYAQGRTALVIGNSAYTSRPLKNPKNDAEDIAAHLSQLGFKVWLGVDLSTLQMESMIHEFTQASIGARVGLFFFAGHGLNIEGRNYLVPIDATINKLIDLDHVKGRMELATETNIILVDACRDDTQSMVVSLGSGQSPKQIGQGLLRARSLDTIIGYSTQPGRTADDGVGRNSPYAKALLRHLQTPMLEIASVLSRVRDDVAVDTRNKQVPWVLSGLSAPVVLNTGGLSAGTVQVRGGASERGIQYIFDLAWGFMPAKLTRPNGAVIHFDKSNRAAILPPLDVARDVISVGKRSAYAEICSIPDGMVRNWKAFLTKAQSSRSWTDAQLVYIRQLHFVVVALMTGKMVMSDSDGKRVPLPSEVAEFVRTPSCDASFREAVARSIESYTKAP